MVTKTPVDLNQRGGPDDRALDEDTGETETSETAAVGARVDGRYVVMERSGTEVARYPFQVVDR